MEWAVCTLVVAPFAFEEQQNTERRSQVLYLLMGDDYRRWGLVRLGNAA